MARKLASIWVAMRRDGTDWSFTTYGTRTEAAMRARLLNHVPNLYREERWRAVRFVRAAERHGKENKG